MSVGYATLYGDMAGGFAVIKDVPKTMVYALSQLRNAAGPAAVIPKRVIDRAPTAELRPEPERRGQSAAVCDPRPDFEGLCRRGPVALEEIAAMGFDRAVVAKGNWCWWIAASTSGGRRRSASRLRIVHSARIGGCRSPTAIVNKSGVATGGRRRARNTGNGSQGSLGSADQSSTSAFGAVPLLFISGGGSR
jgi:hypothetical protein